MIKRLFIKVKVPERNTVRIWKVLCPHCNAEASHYTYKFLFSNSTQRMFCFDCSKPFTLAKEDAAYTTYVTRGNMLEDPLQFDQEYLLTPQP